jgi:uncharacterized protein (TIGR04255 family)
MAHTFENAPLVEIVAELRWQSSAFTQIAAGVGGQVAVAMPGSGKLEEFYMRFGGAAYANGLKRSIRIAPPNFPTLAGDVVYRYQHEESENQGRSTMWQVGPGVFAANALPPYKSWKEFRPTVEKGVRVLLEARDPSEKSLPLSLSLRYLDVFSDDFLIGLSLHDFIENSLGFRTELPTVFTNLIPAGSQPKKQLQIEIPMEEARTCSVNVGQGIFEGKSGVLLQMMVAHNEPLAAEEDKIMAAFDQARDVLHACFEGISQKFWNVLKPVTE